MTSIITAVFKATVGLLVNKGRDVAAERLKEGDVTDQKFRALIVREMQDVKSKLDALSRKDLGAAVDFFETGLKYLYEAIDAKRSDKSRSTTEETNERIKEVNSNEISSPPTDTMKTVALTAGIRNMQLTKFDETTKSALSQAKKRFKMAREKATEASNNEALSTFDRVTAIRYRVMATMLESAAESLGTASDMSFPSVKNTLKKALPECEQCLQKLHSLPAVQNSFKVELEKGLLNIKGRFRKDERREIISTVCQVNRAIYDATQTVGKNVHVWTWPSVDTGEDKVDPLRDGRVTKVLRKVGMEYCSVTPWSFDQEGEEEHKLKHPCGITTNTHGQFIIADNGDKTLKVFDSNGDFHLCFNPQTDDADTKLYIIDVATDVENSTYVLVRLTKPGAKEWEWEVLVYNDTADLLHTFPVPVRRVVRRGYWDRRLTEGDRLRLTVSGSKVLVLSDDGVVDMYEQSGKFLCTFGEGEIKNARDITATNDGRVMVMDCGDSSVHLFTVEGQHLNKFNINIEEDYYYRIACHPAGEHVVVAGFTVVDENMGMTRLLGIAIFTTSGELVRRIQLDEERVWIETAVGIRGMTVTMEGQIAVCFIMDAYHSKVLVIS